MISLKKYMDSVQSTRPDRSVLEVFESDDDDALSAAMAAYASALVEMGDCSMQACPGVGGELKRSLAESSASLSIEMSCAEITASSAQVRELLQDWGRRTAGHYRQKAAEVKDLLVVMARTAESMGTRDRRCAGQIQEVTSRLREIATLDDVSTMRASIEKSAAELKTSIDRMTTEGRAVIEELRKQAASYRARLEEAEEIASRDALTGVRSRLNVENQIEARIATGSLFSVAILDIDDFKKVNDEYGHVTGDDLLKQFAAELRSVCRSTDIIGRWGGDEFIILFDCGLPEAVAQRERLRTWVCGNYDVQAASGATRLSLNISMGVAEHMPGESVKQLLTRADNAMYDHKGVSRTNGDEPLR